MKLSVIIPTCNRNDLLGKCLDLLAPAKQTIADKYEVIVTDDSRENIAWDLIDKTYPWVKWAEGPKRGPAANRNNGAKMASGDWLVFIDDDCLPDKNLLQGYKNGIGQNAGVLAFEGAILPDDWELLKKDMSECPVNTSGGYFWSANICINGVVFKQIDGFDEDFLIAAQEDHDIYRRILGKTKVIFLNDAFVIHPVRKASLLKKIKEIPLSTRNWYVFEKKFHAQKISRVVYLYFKFSFDFTKGFLKNLLKGKIKKSVYYLFLLFCTIPIYLLISIKEILWRDKQ